MANTALRCGISTSLRQVIAPQAKKITDRIALAAPADKLARGTG